MRTSAAIALIFAAPSAIAAPLHLSHSGRLLDASGAPLQGSADLGFALFDTAVSTPAAWSETQTGVVLESGYYAVT